MGTTEPYLVGRWIHDTITADSVAMQGITGLFKGRAPKGVDYPLIIYSLISGTDALAGFGSTNLYVNCLYAVDVYSGSGPNGAGGANTGEASIVPIEGNVRRIFELLRIVPGIPTYESASGRIFGCYREQLADDVGDDEGVAWGRVRQRFRVYATAAA